MTRGRQRQDRRVIVARISEEGLKLLSEIDVPITEQSKELLGHLGSKRLGTLTELLGAAREKAA